MIGRRGRRIRRLDNKLYGVSIEDISKEDLLSAVAYLFLLTQNEKNENFESLNLLYP